MTFAQRRNRLTTHLSERIAVVKRRMTVLPRPVQRCVYRIFATRFGMKLPSSLARFLNQTALWQHCILLAIKMEFYENHTEAKGV